MDDIYKYQILPFIPLTNLRGRERLQQIPLRSNDELISYAIQADNYSEFYRLTDPRVRCSYDAEIKQQRAISIAVSLIDSCMGILDMELNEDELRYILNVLPMLSANSNNRAILDSNINALVRSNMNLIINLRDISIISQLRRYVSDSDLKRFISSYVRLLGLNRRVTTEILGVLSTENRYSSRVILDDLLTAGYISPQIHDDLTTLSLIL